MSRLLLVLALALTTLVTTPARADDEEAPETVEIVATPVFGTGSLPPAGWGEVLVRIENTGKEAYRGEVAVYGGLSSWSDEEKTRTRAPFSAGAGASVSLRIPVRVSQMQDPAVKVLDETGDTIFQQSFVRASGNRSFLIDVAKTSALGAALRGAPVGSRFEPWQSTRGGMATRTASQLEVTSPIYDAVTGDPVLPRRAAGYARVSAVLLRSEELARLPAPELEALAGFILGGGTAAIVITRPEDLRDPALVSFCGDAIREVKVQPETLVEIEPTKIPSGLGAKSLPAQAEPESYLDERLHGYEGGNLEPSPYGASAPYGLGEIHVLAFDPQTKPAVDSAWAHLRVADLVRRANDRMSSVLFRPGGAHAVTTEVRRQLDPNEGSRWALVITALLLLGYSVAAGPGNFILWRRKGRPLKALVWLPLLSLTTFGAVVVVGVVAKGCSGRARHLTVVEAGAGMKTGTARRWRGFYLPDAEELTIRTSSATSVLGTEMTSSGDEVKDELLLDRDGLRLVDQKLRPWETLVVREDGAATFGEGVTVLPKGKDGVEIINRTGKRLLGVVVHLPSGETRFRATLDDGGTAASDDMDKVSRVVMAGPGAVGGMSTREVDPYAISRKLDSAASGLTEAWAAVSDAVGTKDWFPPDVPVVLAQLEGGEGDDSDAGLDLDSDRVLLRIVGYGGSR